MNYDDPPTDRAKSYICIVDSHCSREMVCVMCRQCVEKRGIVVQKVNNYAVLSA